MRREDLPGIAIQSFLPAVEFVAERGATTISESSIEPVEALQSLGELEEYEQAGREAVGKTVVIKLNGRLGTSVSLSKANSLLPVRKGLTFLDLIARQIISQRTNWQSELSLVLMNSYRTRGDSLKGLCAYPELANGVALDFLAQSSPDRR